MRILPPELEQKSHQNKKIKKKNDRVTASQGTTVVRSFCLIARFRIKKLLLDLIISLMARYSNNTLQTIG